MPEARHQDRHALAESKVLDGFDNRCENLRYRQLRHRSRRSDRSDQIGTISRAPRPDCRAHGWPPRRTRASPIARAALPPVETQNTVLALALAALSPIVETIGSRLRWISERCSLRRWRGRHPKSSRRHRSAGTRSAPRCHRQWPTCPVAFARGRAFRYLDDPNTRPTSES
jgi:hypothetical protein